MQNCITLGLSLFTIFNLLLVIVAEVEKTESDFYIGGVVEYSSSILSDTSPKIPTEKYIQDNVNEYIRFLKGAKDQNVDILVFPEATLNYVRSRDDMIKYGIELPNAKEKIAPWKHPQSYSEILTKLSKEIKDNKIYTLINLIEREPCSEIANANVIKCKRENANGFNIYNSNAVFDREGRLISRYRKYNLFNEPQCDVPDRAELAYFETDFGVQFGHFICFDIMFKEPALSLVRSKLITNFLYPSYWFSELPFLTSVQTHFGWAYANNVNFLSAGGNTPQTGTSGTGIISGNKYTANTLISGKIEKRLLISELPKQVHINCKSSDAKRSIIKTPSVSYSPVEMKNLKTTEGWSTYNVLTWNITNDETQRICVHTDICCTFNIHTKKHNIPAGEISYQYKLVANYTNRLYSNDRSCGELYCSIVACTTDNPNSCGKRFKDNTKLFNAIDFDRIIITADVKVLTTTDDLLIMPNSLDTSMTPINTRFFKFNKLQSIRESGSSYERYQIEAKQTLKNLLAFGIYGRNFALDRLV